MRIISQDGSTDIPYENFVFGIVKDNYIVAVRDTVARPSEVANGVVAKYSTEEKAEKAMEMLHMFYSDNDYHNKIFQFPADKDVEVRE